MLGINYYLLQHQRPGNVTHTPDYPKSSKDLWSDLSTSENGDLFFCSIRLSLHIKDLRSGPWLFSRLVRTALLRAQVLLVLTAHWVLASSFTGTTSLAASSCSGVVTGLVNHCFLVRSWIAVDNGWVSIQLLADRDKQLQMLARICRTSVARVSKVVIWLCSSAAEEKKWESH